MAKAKTSVPSILEAVKKINKNEFLPVYYFFGEDGFSLTNAVKTIEKKIEPSLTSDFDKEIFYGEKKSLPDILNFAAAFPFGSEKKLIIVNNFEKVEDKETLKPYLDSPSDFTILVLIHNGKITSFKNEPFKTLTAKNYIFSANSLKGKNLLNWLIGYCESNGKSISSENAQALIDIVGEDRNLIEAQLEKIFTFTAEKNSIALENITSLSSALKEYTIFDLQNYIGQKNKAASFRIAFKLLDQGLGAPFIIYMLTKFFSGLSRIKELGEKKVPVTEASRIVGTHHFYYKNYENARKLYSDEDLLRISNALIEAELTIKSISAEEKSVISMLLAEILLENKK